MGVLEFPPNFTDKTSKPFHDLPLNFCDLIATHNDLFCFKDMRVIANDLIIQSLLKRFKI